MKTSNIILLGVLILILAGISTTIMHVKNFVKEIAQVDLSGIELEQARTVALFSEISIEQGIVVYYTQDSTQSVVVKADTSLINKVVTTVSEGCLKLSLNKVLIRKSVVEVRVSAPQLFKVDCSSGCQFIGNGLIRGDEMKLNLSSGAIADIQGEWNLLSISTNTGAISNVKGKSEQLKVDSSTGAVVSAESLVSQKCKAETSTGGVVNINVEGEIEAEASTGGMINCKGTPRVVRKELSTGGMLNL